MIVDVIRASFLKLLTAANSAYISFTANGRDTELISGKIYQHYGFRSNPYPGTNQIVLQYGNNCVSVAEHDGTLGDVISKQGDVSLYATDPTDSSEFGGSMQIILSPKSKSAKIFMLDTDGTLQLAVGNDPNALTEISIENGKVTIKADEIVIDSTTTKLGDSTASYLKLVTESFINTVYASHVHPAPGGATSAPTPITDPSSLTSNTKAN